jgi:hypothetical protein
MAQNTRALQEQITSILKFLDAAIRLRLPDFDCPLSGLLVPDRTGDLGVKARISSKTKAVAHLLEIRHEVLSRGEEGWPIGLEKVSKNPP